MNVNPIRPCAECPNLTRPSRTLVGDYPMRTLQRNGNLCIACYKRAMKRDCPEPVSRPAHEYNLAGLASFLRRRHEREAAAIRREFAELLDEYRQVCTRTREQVSA